MFQIFFQVSSGPACSHPSPGPLSGLQSVWMEKNRHTWERVIYGEPSGLGIISGSCYLPATCRPMWTGGTWGWGRWPCPGWTEVLVRDLGQGQGSRPLDTQLHAQAQGSDSQDPTSWPSDLGCVIRPP